MSTHKVTRMQYVSSMCVVCGEDNGFGLHGHFYVLEGGLLYATFDPLCEHQSYPGRMHGGIAGAIIDEMIGRAVNVTDAHLENGGGEVFAVTMDLKTRYRKPTPYGQPLYSVARITKDTHRIMEGEGFLYTMEGDLCMEGSARYMKLSPEKISGEPMGEKDWHPDLLPCPETIEIPVLPW